MRCRYAISLTTPQPHGKTFAAQATVEVRHLPVSRNQLLAGASMAMLWGCALFGALEADIWVYKMLIIGSVAPLSFGLDRFFYGRADA